ncbi:CBS domain-containing protein [Candidatus Woesearchaeota archaeon]|nr:CBS domain-containing protein [Candidatus Woesearchaeota archaeon]
MATIKDIITKEYPEVSINDNLSKAIAKLRKNDMRTAIVTRRRKYYGIFDRKQLLTAKKSPDAKVRDHVKHPPVVDINTDLVEAAELMYHSYPCILVTKKGDKFIGIVRARDFIHKIKNFPELKKLNVSKVMTEKPIILRYEDRLGKALNLMRENKIGRIPIINKKNQVISIFSITDVIEQILLRPKHKIKGHRETSFNSKGSKVWVGDKHFLLDTNVGDLASRKIIRISPGAKLSTAINKMYKYKISDLVVTLNKKPLGIITTRDLLETFLRLKEPEFWPIQYYGIDDLKPFQAQMIKTRVREKFDKIKRAYFSNVVYLNVHIKHYEEGLVGKAGKKGRTKWTVTLRFAMPAHTFTTKESHFQLGTAASRALKELDRVLREFKEKFRVQTGEFKGMGRREEARKRQLRLARERKMKALKAKGEKRKLGKVFPPLMG